MPILLHLSDLHLGRKGDTGLGADPAGVLPKAPNQRRDFVIASLRHLASDLDGRKLDCVVISGDIVDRAADDEFQHLPEILDALGPAAPSADRVVVVPGNHDLAWEPPPPARERYEPWLEHVVRPGYVSPFLDGFSDAELKDLAGNLNVVAETNDLLVVPINSSQFCWTLAELNDAEPLWDEIIDAAAAFAPVTWGGKAPVLKADPDERREQVRQALDNLRRHDMARISADQLTRVRNSIAGRRGDKVVIAVLHHHLTPVTAREELKSFESLTNLGEVKQALADFGVSVILHGHKHESGIFWDTLPHGPVAMAPYGGMRAALVVAAPGEFSPGGPIGRLLEFGGPTKSRWLKVNSVRGGRNGPALEAPSVFDLWRTGASAEPDPLLATITGPDVHTVYDRLQAHAQARAGTSVFPNLVCQIADGSLADTLPLSFPEIREPDPQAWFTKLVGWWQRPEGRSLGGDVFNHGERIRTRWNKQLDRAINVLSSAGTTRAVLELLDPASETGARDRRFPSLVVVQFGRRDEGVSRFLDVFGYWRKQELRYWWPVNVAELRMMQMEVIGKLKDDIQPGTLTTYAFHGHVGAGLPTVYLPEVDRAVDEDPGRLVRLVYGVMQPGAVDVERVLEEWTSMLDDLVVAHPVVGSNHPRFGLAEMSSDLRALLDADQREDADGLPGLVLQQLVRVASAQENDDQPSLEREARNLRVAVERAMRR